MAMDKLSLKTKLQIVGLLATPGKNGAQVNPEACREAATVARRASADEVARWSDLAATLMEKGHVSAAVECGGYALEALRKA